MIFLFSVISATFSRHIHSHSVFVLFDKEIVYFRYNASLIGIISNKNSVLVYPHHPWNYNHNLIDAVGLVEATAFHLGSLHPSHRKMNFHQQLK